MITIKDYFPRGLSNENFVPTEDIAIVAESNDKSFKLYLSTAAGKSTLILREPEVISICSFGGGVEGTINWLKSRMHRLLIVNTDPVIRLQQLKSLNEVIVGLLEHETFGNAEIAEEIKSVELIEWSDIEYERAALFAMYGDDNPVVFAQTLDNVTVTARVLFGLQRVEFELKHVYVSNSPEMVETLTRAFAYPLDGEWEQQINEALGAMLFLAGTLRKEEKLEGRVYPEYDFVCEECGAQYQIRVPLTGLTIPKANVQCKECGHVQYVATK